MPYRPTSVNFRLSDGTDLSNLGWITKDYLLSVYPQIGSQIGIPPELWAWGNGNLGVLGNASTTSTSTPITTFTGGSVWKQIGSGSYFTAAIKTDGTLWTWGNNATGQLGNASTTDSSTPVTTFAGGNNWKSIDCGNSHTAAIKTDGTLWVWGNEDSGRVGNGDTTGTLSTPVTTFTGGTNWTQVSCGDSHTTAIKSDSTLWVWGNGSLGRLGVGSTVNKSVPTILGTIYAYDQTSFLSEELFTLDDRAVIDSFNRLWVWGPGGLGRIGNGTTTGTVSTPVTTFAGGTNWKQISSAGSFCAAIKTDGTLWIWGNGGSGRLGNGITTGSISTPITTFAGGTNWTHVSAGYVNVLATKTDGTLWTWGNGTDFALGIGNDTTNRSTPITTFTGGTNWKQVSSGRNYSTAIKTDGTLWTWGNRSVGQLGNGSTVTEAFTSTSTPVTTFAGGTNWADTAGGLPEELYTLSGGSNASAAIKTDGTLWLWGSGSYGRLGNASTTNSSTPVTTFSGGTNWKQVSCGGYFTAAIKTDGTLWTWGNASTGTLGNATTTPNVTTPITTFAGGTDWKQVSCGFRFTAAIKTDGTLWTWGNASGGPLGNATTSNSSTPVTTFAGGTDWKQVSAGVVAAAIKTDGTLWTWGNGSQGRLGNAVTTGNISTPVTTFAGGTNWKQVSSGYLAVSAVKTDGTLWSWGNGNNGRLGNASTTNSSTPVTTFSGGTNWKQVSSSLTSSTAHAAAVKTDGTLWTWGSSGNGRLGNGLTATGAVSTPITTFAGGTNWKQASAGFTHTIALKDDGVNKELYLFGTTSSMGGGFQSAPYMFPNTTFAGGTDWKQVSASSNSIFTTSAIKTDGTLWIWGNGIAGKLGNAVTTNVSTPITTFTGGTNWQQVSVGYRATAAIKTDGTLWTWGNTTTGALGNATSAAGTVSTPITTFAGGTNWKQVNASGYGNMAASKTDATLWVWGNGGSGYLGNATVSNASTPVTIFSASDNTWRSVSAGGSHTSAIKLDRTLWTWGNNATGQLGNASTTNSNGPVTTFIGGSNWSQLSAGGSHTAAVKTDGTLWTWGNEDSGRVGNGDTTGTMSTPVTTFSGGVTWKKVECATNHTVGLKVDGTLWTWGNNADGQLGNSTTTNASVPVTTSIGGGNWKQISASDNSTVAIRSIDFQ